jgi:hypothetical protein
MQLISLTTSNLDFNINKNFPVEHFCSTGNFNLFFRYILYKWRGVVNQIKRRIIIMKEYQCTNPHVEEFINMMVPTTEEKGYSYKEIHAMYVSFMEFFT